MTTQETIDYLTFIRNAYKNLNENPPEEFRIIGKGVDVAVEYNQPSYSEYVVALNLAISALEKQTPKKLHYDEYTGLYFCPNCEKIKAYDVSDFSDYCESCGQALDWRNT